MLPFLSGLRNNKNWVYGLNTPSMPIENREKAYHSPPNMQQEGEKEISLICQL
jgi:hypothetical protein